MYLVASVFAALVCVGEGGSGEGGHRRGWI